MTELSTSRKLETGDGAEQLDFELAGLADLAGLKPREVVREIVIEGGREVVRVGDVETATRLWEEDGGLGRPEGASSIVTVAGFLRCVGVGITTRDVAAVVERNGLIRLVASSSQAAATGGLSPTNQLQFFKGIGIPAILRVMAHLEPLAAAVQDGQSVLANVNAAILWREELGGFGGEQYGDCFRDGRANHSIQVTGFTADPVTEELIGFYVNDPAFADGAGRYISANTMRLAAIGNADYPALGTMIATELRHRPAG
jgi:hypothetical protein